MKCKNVVVRKTFISRFKLSCIQDPLVKRLDPHFTWIRSFLEYCPSKAGSTISTTFSLFVSLGRAWKKNKNITVFFSDWDVKMKYQWPSGPSSFFNARSYPATVQKTVCNYFHCNNDIHFTDPRNKDVFSWRALGINRYTASQEL